MREHPNFCLLNLLFCFLKPYLSFLIRNTFKNRSNRYLWILNIPGHETDDQRSAGGLHRRRGPGQTCRTGHTRTGTLVQKLYNQHLPCIVSKLKNYCVNIQHKLRIVSFQWTDMATLYMQYITYWQFIVHMYWYKYNLIPPAIVNIHIPKEYDHVTCTEK